jgi:hypothetical protein
MNLLYSNIDVFQEIFRKLALISNFNDGKFDQDDTRAIRKFGIIIQKLCCVDHYLNNLMSDTERAQKIISAISRIRKYETIPSIMYHLNKTGGIYFQMYNTIGNLFDIAFDKIRNFSDNDLNDSWILNVRKTMDVDVVKHKLIPYKDLSIKKPAQCKFKQMVCHYKPYSLLQITFLTKSLDKMEMLLKAGIAIDTSILVDIAKNRSLAKYKQKHKNNKIYYLTVAQLLLEKNAAIDKELSLMIAAYNDDEEYTFMLLKYGSDPYKKIKITNQLSFPFFYDRDNEILKNTFDVIIDKLWFDSMIKDMKI